MGVEGGALGHAYLSESAENMTSNSTKLSTWQLAEMIMSGSDMARVCPPGRTRPFTHKPGCFHAGVWGGAPLCLSLKGKEPSAQEVGGGLKVRGAGIMEGVSWRFPVQRGDRAVSVHKHKSHTAQGANEQMRDTQHCHSTQVRFFHSRVNTEKGTSARTPAHGTGRSPKQRQ